MDGSHMYEVKKTNTRKLRRGKLATGRSGSGT
jgi:hypothetical protein